MSKHLFGQVVTPYGTAANNRGETEGNITTLQKILWRGAVHTTVSAEALRWALRYYWQMSGIPVNRVWDTASNSHTFQDANWSGWSPAAKKGTITYIDDDALGFMRAEAGKQDGEKGSAIVRKGMLEFTRAISLLPFAGDITFNAKSGEKTNTSLYGTEVHATRYQFGFSLTPQMLREKERAGLITQGILNLHQVAGNQSRFLYDFSPESVLLRWTDDFAPRILYAFEEKNAGITIPSVVAKVNSGDIDGSGLIIAGPVTSDPAVANLKAKGVSLFDGVRQGFAELEKRMQLDLK